MSFLISNAAYAVYLLLFCLAVAFCVIWLASRIMTSNSPTQPTLPNPGKPKRRTSLRDPIIADAPYPIWQTNQQGNVVFANKSYLRHADKVQNRPTNKPIPSLFSTQQQQANNGTPYRVSTRDLETEATYWFDITSVANPDGATHYATDANATVTAEVAQRKFVQTLTKTFAQLSIGLAIFDRNRQLALFNPALIDLTALSAEFLSGRPNLQAFFDRMRETRMIPEPKDYASWRKQIADVVVAASDGRYCETWSLPSGLTYRVTGRPHPDGAVAFLFEDISAEISLTRHFRAELELGHSVLDTLDNAICVFSPAGVLTLCNLAYQQLWGVNPDLAFAEMTVRDAIRHWQSKYHNPELWQKTQTFVLNSGLRQPWQAQVKTHDGLKLAVKVSPIAGGATLLTFTCNPAPASTKTIAQGKAALPQGKKKLKA